MIPEPKFKSDDKVVYRNKYLRSPIATVFSLHPLLYKDEYQYFIDLEDGRRIVAIEHQLTKRNN